MTHNLKFEEVAILKYSMLLEMDNFNVRVLPEEVVFPYNIKRT